MTLATPVRTAGETALLDAFANSAGANEPARAAAMARFATLGLPGRRDEPWHYTDLRSLLKGAPARSDAGAQEDGAKLRIGPQAQIVFSGANMRAGALPAGVRIAPLDANAAPLLAEADDALAALNAAFVTHACEIVIGADAGEAAIHVAFRDLHEAPAAFARRLRVRLEPGARATIVETHESRAGLAHLSNTLVEFDVATDARARHLRVNAAGDAVAALSTLCAQLGEAASFDSFSLATGARLARHQIFLRFAGEGARAALSGVNLLRGEQHGDVTLAIDHAVPHCESRETFRNVVDDKAVGVFQGRIRVAQHAQKTDARMSSKSLLLSEEATMNNKPELEIFADDVQCAHGATCGELDDDLLFFLMARGLPRPQAEALLLEAFVGDVIDGIEDEALREQTMECARDWLALRAPADATAREATGR
jgi:Fe-S cluster assembly protein SufD